MKLTPSKAKYVELEVLESSFAVGAAWVAWELGMPEADARALQERAHKAAEAYWCDDEDLDLDGRRSRFGMHEPRLEKMRRAADYS